MCGRRNKWAVRTLGLIGCFFIAFETDAGGYLCVL